MKKIMQEIPGKNIYWIRRKYKIEEFQRTDEENQINEHYTANKDNQPMEQKFLIRFSEKSPPRNMCKIKQSKKFEDLQWKMF